MYKPILGYENYLINEYGQLMRPGKRGRRMWYAGSIMLNGYVTYSLTRGGVTKRFLAHRLVLETFIGPCPIDHEARHLNGDRQDNRLANLEWGTRSDNMQDAVGHGTLAALAVGEDHNTAKYEDALVRAVRAEPRYYGSRQAIATKYGIPVTTIDWLTNRRKGA